MPYGRRSEDNWEIWNTRIRDAILFIVGILGIINELFIMNEPRSSALLFLGSLVGLPFVLNADERRRTEKDPKNE